MSEDRGLSRIKSVHLKDAAYEALRDAITGLELAPGQAISENMLVKQLGISKTPIRAALGRLEVEGLVETISSKGTFVCSVDDDDAADLIELRIALEVAAVRAACARATDEQLSDLFVVAQRASIDEAAGEHHSALRDIGYFHDRLVRLSGNARLESAFLALTGPLMQIRAMSGAQSNSIDDSSDEHAEIVDAMVRRDADRASKLVEIHLSRILSLYRTFGDTPVTQAE